ncbi:hypothetical protein COOONC_18626 [Cooperia oncophora]
MVRSRLHDRRATRTVGGHESGCKYRRNIFGEHSKDLDHIIELALQDELRKRSKIVCKRSTIGRASEDFRNFFIRKTGFSRSSTPHHEKEIVALRLIYSELAHSSSTDSHHSLSEQKVYRSQPQHAKSAEISHIHDTAGQWGTLQNMVNNQSL